MDADFFYFLEFVPGTFWHQALPFYFILRNKDKQRKLKKTRSGTKMTPHLVTMHKLIAYRSKKFFWVGHTTDRYLVTPRLQRFILL